MEKDMSNSNKNEIPNSNNSHDGRGELNIVSLTNNIRKIVETFEQKTFRLQLEAEDVKKLRIPTDGEKIRTCLLNIIDITIEIDDASDRMVRVLTDFALYYLDHPEEDVPYGDDEPEDIKYLKRCDECVVKYSNLRNDVFESVVKLIDECDKYENKSGEKILGLNKEKVDNFKKIADEYKQVWENSQERNTENNDEFENYGM